MLGFCEYMQDLIACSDDWECLEVVVYEKYGKYYSSFDLLPERNNVAIVTHDNIEILQKKY